MATRNQVLEVLTTLSKAFPEKKLEKDTLELYADLLSDIPHNLLVRAADAYIRNSNWFPRIAQLRKVAAELAGTSVFTSLTRGTVPDLNQAAVALERDFYLEGYMDEGKWEQLAVEYALAGCAYRVEYTRGKMERLKKIARVA